MNNLYHYTSLETLALILKNKTLCFNNLLNVDDIEEAQNVGSNAFKNINKKAKIKVPAKKLRNYKNY